MKPLKIGLAGIALGTLLITVIGVSDRISAHGWKVPPEAAGSRRTQESHRRRSGLRGQGPSTIRPVLRRLPWQARPR